MSDLDLLDQLTEPGPEPTPAVGAAAITADLLARLKRHYLPPQPMPGGVFVTEVGENGAWGASSRADALYVGFTSASGRLLIGHEIKATRSDWLTELRKPGKADTWADQCHEWWLVTVPGVVADGELPAGWGLMVPGKSRTRMKVVTPARRHTDRQPSWDAVRSIMSRLDTLQRAERAAFERDLTPKIRARLEREREQAERSDLDRVGRRQREAVEILEHLNGILGVQISDDEYGTWGRKVTTDEVREIAQLLDQHVTLRNARRALASRYEHTVVASILEHAQALAEALATIGDLDGGAA